jgi:CRP/FNR family cyclic AMP-dependent transcriptional regulator
MGIDQVIPAVAGRLAFAVIDEFMVYSSEQRMARRLVERLPHDGSSKIIISQSDLGALVGVSRQSTNKILKRWESRAWIKRLYRGVEVCNCEALKGLS